MFRRKPKVKSNVYLELNNGFDSCRRYIHNRKVGIGDGDGIVKEAWNKWGKSGIIMLKCIVSVNDNTVYSQVINVSLAFLGQDVSHVLGAVNNILGV